MSEESSLLNEAAKQSKEVLGKAYEDLVHICLPLFSFLGMKKGVSKLLLSKLKRLIDAGWELLFSGEMQLSMREDRLFGAECAGILYCIFCNWGYSCCTRFIGGRTLFLLICSKAL